MRTPSGLHRSRRPIGRSCDAILRRPGGPPPDHAGLQASPEDAHGGVSAEPRAAHVKHAEPLTRRRAESGQPWNSVAARHDALAAGRLVAVAELARLLCRGERPDHGPEKHAFAAKIRAADDRLAS